MDISILAPDRSNWDALIAKVIYDDEDGARLKNGHLIKAAPQMYDALEAVMEWARTPGDHGGNPYRKEFVKKAEAALAAAGKEPTQ